MNCSFVAAAGGTATVSVRVIATPPTVAEITFGSATVALRVPVVAPALFVGPAGCVSELPLPLAASTTLLPGIALPNPSRAVTVTVVALPPLEAVIDAGTAFTVVCAGLMLPGRAYPRKSTGVPMPVARTDCTLSATDVVVPSAQLVVAIPLPSAGDGSGAP